VFRAERQARSNRASCRYGFENAGMVAGSDFLRESRGSAESRAELSAPGRTGPLIAVLASIGVFRVVALAFNSTDLYVDEAQYWAWAQAPAFGYFSKPPLIAWIIAGATSVCGDGEFCVRLPSVAIHLATSFVLYLIGRRLYSDAAGFWAALTYATLPAVSLSSGIISTDVPLLFAWAVALLGFVELLKAPRLAAVLLLAAGLGLGLNAKYAMAYFVPCAALFFVMAPDRLALLKRPHLWGALAAGCVLILPNLAWNAANGYATFAHTADNAQWKGFSLHPGKAAEFVLAQFGVFGPILFGTLIAIVWRARGRLASLPEADRLLLAFSVPIILAVTAQGLLSRAHANWAAPAYVAGSVLVVGVMVRESAWRWLAASQVLHAFVAVLLALGTWQAGSFKLPGAGDPFARTLGNRELGEIVGETVAEAKAAGRPFGAILTQDREICAALLYYARTLGVPVYAWKQQARPRSHFELSRPYTADAPTRVLLVSPPTQGDAVARSFADVRPMGQRAIRAGAFSTRAVNLFALEDFKGG
jgi:4-amino-4-deoxy-L-arabinose transferase-like glycosyltransferase